MKTSSLNLCRVLVTIILLLTFLPCLKSQKNEFIQIAGYVFNQDYQPLEFVNIIVNNKRGTITDRAGKFSFIGSLGDTIIYSSIGYKRDTIYIPKSFTEKIFFADVMLKQDTLELKEVIIVPYGTYEDFLNAVLALKLPESDIDRARKNIALMKAQAEMADKPDAGVNFKRTMQQHYDKIYIAGQYPTLNVLNPKSWAEFFEKLNNGELKIMNDAE